MIKKFTTSKRGLAKYSAATLITSVILIEFLTGNWAQWHTPPFHDCPSIVDIKTTTEMAAWYDNQTIYYDMNAAEAKYKHIFNLVPFLLLLLFSYKRFDFDRLDRGMIMLAIFEWSCNEWDWLNGNTRGMTNDIIVTVILLTFLWVAKVRGK